MFFCNATKSSWRDETLLRQYGRSCTDHLTPAWNAFESFRLFYKGNLSLVRWSPCSTLDCCYIKWSRRTRGSVLLIPAATLARSFVTSLLCLVDYYKDLLHSCTCQLWGLMLAALCLLRCPEMLTVMKIAPRRRELRHVFLLLNNTA